MGIIHETIESLRRDKWALFLGAVAITGGLLVAANEFGPTHEPPADSEHFNVWDD